MNPDDQQASLYIVRWYALLAIVLGLLAYPTLESMVRLEGVVPTAVSGQKPSPWLAAPLALAVAVAWARRRAEHGARLHAPLALGMTLFATVPESTGLASWLLIVIVAGVASTLFWAHCLHELECLSRHVAVEVVATLVIAALGGCQVATILPEPVHPGVVAMLVVLLAVVLGNVCDRLRGVRAAGAGSGIWPLVLGFGLGLHLAVGSPLDAIDVNDWTDVMALATAGGAQSGATIALLAAVVGILSGAALALLAASRRGVLAAAVAVALWLACAPPWLVADPPADWSPLAVGGLAGALTLGAFCALLLSGALELGLVPVALVTGWSVGVTSGLQAQLTLFAGSVYAVAGVLALAGHRRAKRHGKADAPSA